MMGAFLYGTALQWRLDIRSRTLLITCYVVPLLFFAMMGGIFTSVNLPRGNAGSVHDGDGVSMGALIGRRPRWWRSTAAISKCTKPTVPSYWSHPGALVHISASDADERGDRHGCAACTGAMAPADRQRFSVPMALRRVAERGRRAWGGGRDQRS
ncbi:MAG: hypothetical protein ACLR7U_14900 [Ruthenibacterium lactatiformans]